MFIRTIMKNVIEKMSRHLIDILTFILYVEKELLKVYSKINRRGHITLRFLLALACNAAFNRVKVH